MSTKLRICFVAHFAHRAISGLSDGHIGGVERQTNLMARWLAAKGHEVSVIVWDEGQGREVEYDGIRVISVCRQDAGIPGLRFFTPRWSSLRAALKRADADVYYHNCAEYVTGQVALWAASNRRKFVYSVASDPGCVADLPTLTKFRERYLYRIGLRKADLVIAQTAHQQDLLQENFDLASTVLPMPCEALPPSTGVAEIADRPRLLWIGRLAPVKRAELAIKVAAECPEYDFDIVGPDGSDGSYVSMLRDQGAQCSNVNWVGPINFADVRQYYERSSALLCTSEFEGFPNTFLEAWSCGCPVVSTVDPDNVISTHYLGQYVARDEDLAADLRRFLNDDEAQKTSAQNSRNYFHDRHEKGVAMQRFEEALAAVVARGTRDSS